jgi:hypothetical protein
MKFNFLLQALAAGLITFCLSSCDGGGGGGGDDDDVKIIFEDVSRYNTTTLENNSNATAELPRKLVGFSDKIFLQNTGFDPGLNFPTYKEEAEGTLIPGSSFSLLIRQQRYDYTQQNEGAEAKIDLIEINPARNIATGGSTADRRYENGLVLLQQTGAGDPGPTFGLSFPSKGAFFASINNVLKDLPSPNPERLKDSFDALSAAALQAVKDEIGTVTVEQLDNGSLTLVEAVDQVVGYEAVNFPGAVGVAGFTLKRNGTIGKWELDTVNLPVENAMVLSSRVISLIPTSNNQQLIDTFTIDGTYEIDDTYEVLFASAKAGDGGWTLTVSPGGGGDFGSPGAKRDKEPTISGAFTLQLETLGTVAP